MSRPANELAEAVGRETLEGAAEEMAAYLDAQEGFAGMMERGAPGDGESVDGLMDESVGAGDELAEALGGSPLVVHAQHVYHFADLDWAREWRDEVDAHRGEGQ